MTAPQTPSALPEAIRNTLRKQIAIFFTEMQRAEPGWPHVTNEQLVEGVADALLDMGKASGVGVAMLQTLTYELQERVNAHINQGN